MATNRFKSHFATATTGEAAAAFTNANTGTDKIVVGMTISNITNIAQTVSVYVHSNVSVAAPLKPAATNNKLFSLVTDASIPAGGSLVPIGGDQKVVIQPGESINVNTSGALSCHVVVSTLEISDL